MSQKAKILDLQGNIINPDPPAGFYACGNCPECNAPLFHHGGGEYIDHSTFGPSTIQKVNEAFFTVCDHDQVNVQVQLPDSYHLLAERQALLYLFSAVGTLQRINRELGEQLQEAMEELGHSTSSIEPVAQ